MSPSSCLALSDLLRGHDTPYIHSRLPEIFDIVLRLKDDVKVGPELLARISKMGKRVQFRQHVS